MKNLVGVVLLLTCAAVHAGNIESHAVVFLYHRFGDSRYPSTNTRLDQFDAQLKYLASHDYHVWSLARIVQSLREGKTVPDHTVAITIDDAYQSVYENAYPRLRSRGWPFTLFVSTDVIDRKLPDFMTWDEMREMQAHGASFADHTATHGHLVVRKSGESDLAWADRIRADIQKGQERLQQEFGTATNKNPKLFAYPYGEYDTDLAKLVNGLGFVAFGQESGAIGVKPDPRALPRFPMAEAFADLGQFQVKAETLPFPITGILPWDPVIGNDNPPSMKVRLAPSTARLSGLVCYFHGSHLDVRWNPKNPDSFEVSAAQPLPAGRSRYNCTAPSRQGRRYYWYSHPWLVIPAALH